MIGSLILFSQYVYMLGLYKKNGGILVFPTQKLLKLYKKILLVCLALQAGKMNQILQYIQQAKLGHIEAIYKINVFLIQLKA